MSEDSKKTDGDTKDESITSKARKPKDPLLGKLIDNKYEILSQLGGGGMGMVYTAKHALMNRTVAIKVLHPHLGGSQEDEFFKRFLREAQTSSRLSHPNCITIFDFGIDGDYPFLVMELRAGRSLKQLLKEEAPLPPARVLSILSQICAGMQEAHRLGIVHRDLKPDNIIVTDKGHGVEQAVVLDFGIAKVVGGGTEVTSMTQTGGIIGTPQYMAPEQVLGKELDARCDVYALGVILYEMLSGEVPFEADSAMALMMKHLSEEPLPIRTLKSELDIPQAIEPVLAKVLKKEPSERFESVEDFKIALTAALDSSTETQTLIETRSESRTNTPWALYASGFALVLALAGGSYSLMQGTAVVSTPATPPVLKLATQNSTDVELNRARTLLDSGDFKRASLLLQEALSQVENAETHSLLGNCYVGLKQSSAALNHFNKALDLSPNHTDTRYSLAILLAERGELNNASRQLQRAIVLQPLLLFQAREEKLFQGSAFEEVLL